MSQLPPDITVLLDQWRGGDPEAFERLVPAAYDHLHAIAEGYIRGAPGRLCRRRRWSTSCFFAWFTPRACSTPAASTSSPLPPR